MHGRNFDRMCNTSGVTWHVTFGEVWLCDRGGLDHSAGNKGQGPPFDFCARPCLSLRHSLIFTMPRQTETFDRADLPLADPAFVNLLRSNGFLPTLATPRVLPQSPPSLEEQDRAPRQSFEYAFSALSLTEEEWASLDDEDPLSPSPPSPPSVVPHPKVHSGAPAPKSTLSSRPAVVEDIGPRVFKFSPSVLAHHANTACEKMLHLKGEQLYLQSLEPKSNVVDPADPVMVEPETISEATMARGVVFEAQLQANITNQVDCRKEGDKDSLFRLSTEPEGTTLCQAVFSLGPEFYTPAMKDAGIVFGRFLPDFIQILPGSLRPDGTRKKRVFIIDAKSSSHVKISHQVWLYIDSMSHMCLVPSLT